MLDGADFFPDRGFFSDIGQCPARKIAVQCGGGGDIGFASATIGADITQNSVWPCQLAEIKLYEQRFREAYVMDGT